jgi:hypothetical protein
MLCRRHDLAFVALLVLCLFAVAAGKDEEPAKTGAPGPGPGFADRKFGDEDPETAAWNRAIRDGLAWLARNQHPKEGYWGDYSNGALAVTSLSVLALMANGNTERRGRYAPNVREGIKFLLDKVTTKGDERSFPPIGYIWLDGDEVSKMHAHGYATLALAMAYGTGDRKQRDVIREKLELAVRCIERSQHRSGGWLYDPNPTLGHEGSVTVCQVQALRAARDAGIRVNGEVIRRALDYLLRSRDPDTGGFRYRIEDKREQSYALTAAALTTLFGLGEYDRKDIVLDGIRFMRRSYRSVFGGTERWFFYGNLYAAQTLFQAGTTSWGRPYWDEWWPRMRDMLVDLQQRRRPGDPEPDGSWPHPTRGLRFSANDYGPAYRTAMACLILQVPLGLLPIFER